MGYVILIELICYFGLILLMANMQQHGKLNENYFAIGQLAYISLFILTGFLLAPTTYEVILAWVVITILLWVVGYPIARWIYRQLFLTK